VGWASLVLVVLTQAAPATGPGVHPLVGTVVDSGGRPIGGVEVWLASGSDPAVARPLIGWELWSTAAGPPEGQEVPVLARCRSDAEGRFRIDVPAEVALSQEPVPVALWAYRPGARAAWRRLDWVVPGPEGPVRLVLEPPAGTTVRVLGPDRRPVDHARLAVTALAHLAVPDELAGRLEARTDRDGEAVIPAFAAEEITSVRVAAPRLGMQRGRPSRPDAEGIRTVTLEPAGRVAGRLVGDDGRPVAGLAVRATAYPEGIDLGRMVGTAEVASDAAGRFDIPALAAGRLVLTLGFRPGEPPAYRGQPPVNQVVEAGRTANVEIALRRAVLVRGLVRERGTGAPIPGVRPVLNPARGGDASAVSDAEGRFAGFTLGNQPYGFLYGAPRPYVIPTDAPEAVGHLLPPGATEYTLPPIELARGAAVRGVVVDEAERPVTAALVRASWEPPGGLLQSLTAQTDGKGEFRLEGVDPLADLRLTASCRGASTGAATPARADAERPVTLRISPAHTTPLAGRVVDAAGRPIEGASVRISWSRTRNAQGRVWRRDPVRFDGPEDLVTDAEGRFRTPYGLPRDVEYQAQVRGAGRLPGQTEWIRPGDGREATFPDAVLRRLRVVTGRVVDGQGRPVGGVTVLQSGDGPMRTRAVTDEHGRVRIGGLVEDRAFLFARKEGFRFQGRPIDGADEVELVLTRVDEPPAVTLRTIPGALPKEEEIALARRLLAPYAERVAARGDDGQKYRVLSKLALADPARVLELAETTKFSVPFFNDLLRAAVAQGLAQESPEEAASVAETIQDPSTRVWAYTEISDRVPASDRARRGALLDRAHLQVKTIEDPGGKLRALGRVADRWLDLGVSDRAAAPLREGQAIAREVPATDFDRVTLAEALARVDLPAALALIDRVRADIGRTDRLDRQYVFDRAYGEIAYRLAAPDPAEAERVLGLIRDPVRRDGYLAAAGVRIAPQDLARAERLAARIVDPLPRAYALGMTARALASTDRAAATRLIGAAFDGLDEHRDSLWTNSDASCVAAALLPAVEQIDPALLNEFLWRAVALRPPRPDERGEDGAGRSDAELALNLARYDHATATALLGPTLPRLRSAETETSIPTFVAMAQALIDPRRAVALVEGLTEDPALGRDQPKDAARVAVAEILSQHGDDRWRTLRQSAVSMARTEPSDL
jgi:hypothetical protein